VALTLVVLVLAGLLMKSVLTLQRARPGFDPARVVALRISPPPSRWENFRELADYYERVLAEVRREPGVELATLNCSAPMSGITLRYPFWVEGRPVEEGNADEAVFNAVDADYFRTLRVPLVRGRFFDARDNAKAVASQPVCIINQMLAQRLFGAAEPLGKRIRTLPWMVNGYREVVGIVGDVKQDSLSDEPTAQLYVPQQQSPWFFTTVLVRTKGASATMLEAAIRRADPGLTMSVETMDDALARSTLAPRLRAAVFGVFAGVALALSALGIHASVTFMTAQRRREIGLRMALGATRAMIVRGVLGTAGRWAAAGGAGGWIVTLGATRLLRSAFPGVASDDPWMPLTLALFLAGVALAAAFVPAWRAAQMDPQRALQSE
jgi:predicted permease